PGCTRATEWLLTDNRTGGFVIDLEVAGGIAQRGGGLKDGGAVAAHTGARESERRSSIPRFQRLLPFGFWIDVGCDNGPEDLLAEQAITRVGRLHQCRLDEVPDITFCRAALQDPGVLFRVVQVLADFREGLLVNDRADERPEVLHV